MRTLVVLSALLFAGCATRLPTAAPSSLPAQDLETRFVRCDLEAPPPCALERKVEAETEEFEKNKITLFMGRTHERGEGGGQTLGVGYERRFSRLLGAAVFVDFAAGALQTQVYGAGLVIHPIGKSFVFVAPGIEVTGEDVLGLLRLGIGYDIEVGKGLFIAPAVYADLRDGEDTAWVWGFEFVHEF